MRSYEEATDEKTPATGTVSMRFNAPCGLMHTLVLFLLRLHVLEAEVSVLVLLVLRITDY